MRKLLDGSRHGVARLGVRLLIAALGLGLAVFLGTSVASGHGYARRVATTASVQVAAQGVGHRWYSTDHWSDYVGRFSCYYGCFYNGRMYFHRGSTWYCYSDGIWYSWNGYCWDPCGGLGFTCYSGCFTTGYGYMYFYRGGTWYRFRNSWWRWDGSSWCAYAGWGNPCYNGVWYDGTVYYYRHDHWYRCCNGSWYTYSNGYWYRCPSSAV